MNSPVDIDINTVASPSQSPQSLSPSLTESKRHSKYRPGHSPNRPPLSITLTNPLQTFRVRATTRPRQSARDYSQPPASSFRDISPVSNGVPPQFPGAVPQRNSHRVPPGLSATAMVRAQSQSTYSQANLVNGLLKHHFVGLTPVSSSPSSNQFLKSLAPSLVASQPRGNSHFDDNENKQSSSAIFQPKTRPPRSSNPLHRPNPSKKYANLIPYIDMSKLPTHIRQSHIQVSTPSPQTPQQTRPQSSTSTPINQLKIAPWPEDVPVSAPQRSHFGNSNQIDSVSPDQSGPVIVIGQGSPTSGGESANSDSIDHFSTDLHGSPLVVHDDDFTDVDVEATKVTQLVERGSLAALKKSQRPAAEYFVQDTRGSGEGNSMEPSPPLEPTSALSELQLSSSEQTAVKWSNANVYRSVYDLDRQTMTVDDQDFDNLRFSSSLELAACSPIPHDASIPASDREDVISHVSTHDLSPHVEGGYFRRLYGGALDPTTGDYNTATRSPMSSIYYLLERSDFSAFHLLEDSTEVFVLMDGQGLYIHMIDQQGRYVRAELSPNASLQVAIPPQTWFAAETIDKKGFAFVSCICTPAFLFDRFQLAFEHVLLEKFPQHHAVIKRLCRQ